MRIGHCMKHLNYPDRKDAKSTRRWLISRNCMLVSFPFLDLDFDSDVPFQQYCTAVLLPECIRQILLWQTGLRTSIELLSTSEEQELYDMGEELLNETDWVFDIQRMRQRAERLRLQRSSYLTGRRRAKVDYCEFGD